MRNLSSSLLVAVSALAAGPAIGAPCFFQGADASARVVSRAGETFSPYPEVLSATDCTKLRVMAGTVWVYQTDAKSGKIEKTQVTTGSLVRSSSPNAEASGIDGVVRELKLVAEGLQRTKVGSSRSAENEYLLGILPTGKVVVTPSDLVIAVGSGGSALSSLVITSTKGYKARFSKIPQEIRIPRAALVAGARFTWRVDYQGATVERSFDVVGSDTADEELQAIERALPAEADPLLSALRKSQLLVEQGYRLEARKTLAPLIAGH